ncbi:hypothetical protein VPZ60_004291 [Salmonella enterica]|nr:hypothetical protein [Salmonella enterica]
MAVNVDDRSARLDLPLPNEQNFLQDDVKRLVDSLKYLDSYVATVASDGKLDPYQLPDNAAKLDDAGIILPAQLPATVVVLDNKGKIPVKNLPPAGTTQIHEVSNESGMLALDATPGDICKRLDVRESYILADADPTKASSWRALPVNIVTTVQGQSGDLTNVAVFETNADGSKSLNLDSPLRLKAKASDAYDAVTLGELQTIQAVAGGGASMTGVMNNFLGAVEWFNGSRGSLPAGYVAADGQQLDQADYPELIAALKAGFLNSVTEALWQNSTPNQPNYVGVANRGQYAFDVGAAKFRVPDLNGMQPGSWKGLFLRGNAPSGSFGSTAGVVRGNAAPQIYGEFFNTNWNNSSLTGASQAFYGDGLDQGREIGNEGHGGDRADLVKFSASRSHGSYNRDNTDEVRPNSVTGIWLIRVSGAFKAADTNFHVITADATQPVLNTTAYGGKFVSDYKVGDKVFASAETEVSVFIGQKPGYSILLTDNNGKQYSYKIGGTYKAGGTIPLEGIHYTAAEAAFNGWIYWHANRQNRATVDPAITTSGGTTAKSGPDELMVSVYPNRIVVTGIIRFNMPAGGTNMPVTTANGGLDIYSITQKPPGKTRVRKPYCPCVFTGGTNIWNSVGGSLAAQNHTGTLAGFTRYIDDVNQWVKADGIIGGTTTVIINDTIYFDD